MNKNKIKQVDALADLLIFQFNSELFSLLKQNKK